MWRHNKTQTTPAEAGLSKDRAPETALTPFTPEFWDSAPPSVQSLKKQVDGWLAAAANNGAQSLEDMKIMPVGMGDFPNIYFDLRETVKFAESNGNNPLAYAAIGNLIDNGLKGSVLYSFFRDSGSEREWSYNGCVRTCADLLKLTAPGSPLEEKISSRFASTLKSVYQKKVLNGTGLDADYLLNTVGTYGFQPDNPPATQAAVIGAFRDIYAASTDEQRLHIKSRLHDPERRLYNPEFAPWVESLIGGSTEPERKSKAFGSRPLPELNP